MSNFGAEDLRVARIFYEDFRTAASAVGPAAMLLAAAQDYPALPQAIHDAHFVVGTTGAVRPGFPQSVERLELGAVAIRAALDRGRRVALLFGSEKFGLSNDDLSHCHLLVRIPTRDEHASMNLGQAAALCLYELARQPNAVFSSPLPAGDAANAADMERLTALLSEVLTRSEYAGIGPGTHARQLRSMLRRWRVSARDARLATGFLRQMLWKLGGTPE